MHARTDSQSLPTVAAPESAGAPDAATATFVSELARFFGAGSVLQLDWVSDQQVRAASFQAGQSAVEVGSVAVCAGRRLAFKDAAFDTVFNFGSLNGISEAALPGWLDEIRRVTGRNLWVTLESTPGRDRAWWENRFFAAGFRKHLRTQEILPYISPERENRLIALVLEKVPPAAQAQYPVTVLKAERDLHMDMLRESGPRSDAHLARYQLAARFAKDGDVILDAACGLGYGSAMLARQFPGATVIGVDNSEYAVAYARQNFASILPNLEFHQADVCDLRWLAGRRINLLVSFETIEHVPDPDGFLQLVAEQMPPGARFIGSVPNKWVDETGGDPNPYHLYVFDFTRFHDLLNRHFKVTRVFRQNAERGVKGDHGRILREVANSQPDENDRQNAEWWLLTAEGRRAEGGGRRAEEHGRNPSTIANGSPAGESHEVEPRKTNGLGQNLAPSAAAANGAAISHSESRFAVTLPGCPSIVPAARAGDGPHNICLATNYMLMSPSTCRLWTDLDRALEEFGSRLVLLTTAEPQAPLPFPVIPVPFLIRDYAQQFPLAATHGGVISEYDWQLLAADRSRSGDAYEAKDALPGLLACRRVMNTLLGTLQPGYVLSWDSTTPLAMVLRSLCAEIGLPTQALERGLLPETLMIESHGNIGWTDLRTHWLADEMAPRAGESADYDRICSYYRRFRPEKYPQPDFVGAAELRRKLGLGDRKVVVFFGHGDSGGMVPGDSAQRRYMSPEFASTGDALMALWSVLEKDPDVALIFKPHPADKDPYVVAKLEGIQITRDENVHALIELADVVVALFGTLQYEAALYDKPVVLLGRSAWWGRHATYEVDQRRDLRPVLNQALKREDWASRSANARAFLTWIMDQYLIGCTQTVPARRTLRDFARFIARASLDPRHLPGAVERWQRTEAALAQFRNPSTHHRRMAPAMAASN